MKKSIAKYAFRHISINDHLKLSMLYTDRSLR